MRGAECRLLGNALQGALLQEPLETQDDLEVVYQDGCTDRSDNLVRRAGQAAEIEEHGGVERGEVSGERH